MKSAAFALTVISFCFAAMPVSAVAEEIHLKSAFVKSFDQRNRSIQTTIKLKNVTLPAKIETTDKGNGTLFVPGMALKLWDDHDDGVVYPSQILRIDHASLSESGSQDLVITGIVRNTGEKESDPVSDESVILVLRLNCEKGIFEKVFSVSNVDIEKPSTVVPPIKCSV